MHPTQDLFTEILSASSKGSRGIYWLQRCNIKITSSVFALYQTEPQKYSFPTIYHALFEVKIVQNINTKMYCHLLSSEPLLSRYLCFSASDHVMCAVLFSLSAVVDCWRTLTQHSQRKQQVLAQLLAYCCPFGAWPRFDGLQVAFVHPYLHVLRHVSRTAERNNKEVDSWHEHVISVTVFQCSMLSALSNQSFEASAGSKCGSMHFIKMWESRVSQNRRIQNW